MKNALLLIQNLDIGKRKYIRIRLGLLLLSILIFTTHTYLPKKTLHVYPQPGSQLSSYGYINPHSGKSDNWIDNTKTALRCNYKKENHFGCGLTVKVAAALEEGLDLQGYEKLLISLNYEGPSKHIRVYMRNFDNRYSTAGDIESTKFLSTLLATREIATKPITIPLEDFSVAEWWINQKKQRRRLAEYEIDNIVSFGLDFTEPGEHLARINTIALSGDRVDSVALLLSIVLFWASLMIGEGIVKFFALYRKLQSDKATISVLRKSQKSLEVEREKLKALSTTDPLTGILNRSGVTQKIHANLFDHSGKSDMGVLLIDADHFKSINDRFGHDVGDQTLKHLVNIIDRHKRYDDIFGRWGGEEFILVTTDISKDGLMVLAEKLRKLVEENYIPLKPPVGMTVSIGATIIRHDDIFEEAFKRADQALYQAKQSGRNCSYYA